MTVGVLVSGEGTNLQALIDAGIPIAVVVSNKAEAPALARARGVGIPSVVIDHRARSRESFEDAVLAELANHDVDVVVLAGFMRVLTPRFVDRYALRIVNTHPSLLPAFPGADAVAKALAHGAKVSGVTVHFVDHSLDGGPIIAQAAVPVLPDDLVATLHDRIRREEHRLLPQVVRALAAGRLSCQGRVVVGFAE